MNSLMEKIQLAEERYKEKLRKNLKEFGLNTKKHKKQKKKVEKIKGDHKNKNHQSQNPKKNNKNTKGKAIRIIN